MRRAALLLVLGGAVATLALTARTHTRDAPPGSTRDVIPVVVEPNRTGSVDYVFSWENGPRPHGVDLAAFHGPRAPSDALPAQLLHVVSLLQSPTLSPDAAKSRLLLARGSDRVYGFPTREGGVCFFREPAGGGSCVESLGHGAIPQVAAGGKGRTALVWGLVDDGAVAVDVAVGGARLPAFLGRNAFLLRLSQGVLAPRAIVVRERNGVRHDFVIKRCRITVGGSPIVPPC